MGTDFKKIFLILAVGVGMVVISVIGIKILKKSQVDACVKNLDTLRLALEDFYNQNNFYPDKLSLKDLTFLKPPLPKDTASGKTYIYLVSDDKRHYTLKCPQPLAHNVKDIIATEEKSAYLYK